MFEYSTARAVLDAALDEVSKPREHPEISNEYLWEVTLSAYDVLVDGGDPEAAARKAVCDRLSDKAAFLAPTRSALDRKFYRKLAQWRENGAVRDGRVKANQKRSAPELSSSDREILVNEYVNITKGDLDSAWSNCVRLGKLSLELLQRYPLPRRRRPRCPKTIRHQLTRQYLTRCMDLALRPTHAQGTGPYTVISHLDYFAGDWRTGDDVTLEVYFYPDAAPNVLTRGQFIFDADVRSKKVLGFALVPARGYTQHDIRALWKCTCIDKGNPRNGWYVENGIWRATLAGGKTYDTFDEARRNFADRLGLEIRHAKPRNPKAKIAESIAKLIQKHCRFATHYVGRDEKRIVFEHSQDAIKKVRSKQATALEMGFYSHSEWAELLKSKILPEYNATGQESVHYPRYMSPNEAYEELQPRGADGKISEVTKLSPALEWLFDHQEIKTLGRNGIHIGGKPGLTYRGAVKNFILGASVRVFFDPDKPGRIQISDAKLEKWDVLPLFSGIPKYNATREDLAASYRNMADYDHPQVTIVESIKSNFNPPVRQLLVDHKTVEISRQLRPIHDDQAKLGGRGSGIQPILPPTGRSDSELDELNQWLEDK